MRCRQRTPRTIRTGLDPDQIRTTKPTHITFNNLYKTREQERSYDEPGPVPGGELGELGDDDLLEVSSAIEVEIETEIENIGDPG